MAEFKVAAGAVIPLFIILIFGYYLAYSKILNRSFINLGNKLCFQIFIPALLFCNIYNTDLKAMFDGKIILFVAIFLTLLFIALWFLVVYFEKDNRRRGVLIQGMMRSNFVVLGVPIISNIYGDGNIGLVGLLLSIVLPMYNILSVFALEYFSFQQKIIELNKDNPAKEKPKVRVLDGVLWKNIFLQIITNNLIIASVVAYFFVILNIHLPEILLKPITQIADVSTGFSLLMLGASFQVKTIRASFKQLCWAVSSRLLIIPALALGSAVFLGFRGIALATLVAVFAAPTSVSSFSMTQIIGGDDDLAANIIVFTSLFSIFSLFIFIYIFEYFNLL